LTIAGQPENAVFAMTAPSMMRPHPLLWSVLRVSLTALAGFLVLIVALLLGCQRRLIYFPRRYAPDELRLARGALIEVPYTTAAGRQTAFYVPPREGGDDPGSARGGDVKREGVGERPDRLWVVFGGNAAQALSWLDFVEAYPDKRTAFLLVDYPGYGVNAGRPTRASIVESGVAALAAARGQFKFDAATSPSVSLGLLGHSIGAAAALELAVRDRPDRIVLVSPFTSMMAMARRSVGWPLCRLLFDRFDNEARLAELAARSPRPAVVILHGTADDIVPRRMGEALAAAYPGWIVFHPVLGGDHNWIIDAHRDAIFRVMLGADH
jgi:pimeloyl-ACP methyl ester carboxylesterase